MAQIFTRIGQIGFGLAVAGAVANSALYNVDGGHRAVIFDRVSGVSKSVIGEGTHFMIPWIQKPYIFDIRARPKNVPSVTGSKDLQNVNITLRILFRPRLAPLSPYTDILNLLMSKIIQNSKAPQCLVPTLGSITNCL